MATTFTLKSKIFGKKAAKSRKKVLKLPKLGKAGKIALGSAAALGSGAVVYKLAKKKK